MAMAWTGAEVFLDLGGGHGGRQVDDLGRAIDLLESQDADDGAVAAFEVEATRTLHHHLNAVVWGEAELDEDEFGRLVGLLYDRGAVPGVADRLDTAYTLAKDGSIFAAHDLVVEVEASLREP